MDVLSVLVEIRDLLAVQSRKNPQKTRVKAKLKKKRSPWGPSPYPIQRWFLGTTKLYSWDKRDVLIRRIRHVNKKMKSQLHLPNHFRYRTVIRRGRIYVEVRRDR